MAAGEAIGCFGLTEPDFGSNPGGDAHPRAAATAADWVLNGRKMWITNGSVADVAVVWAQTEEGGGPRLRRPDRHRRASPRPEIKHKMSLRASVTGELVLDDVRLPADGDAARACAGCAGRCPA